MKAILFQAVTEPRDPSSPVIEHTLYSVLLGNGHRAYFTSARHADQFNADAVRFLNRMLFRANLLLADAYPAWRMAWYYLDSQPTGDRSAMLAMGEAQEAMDRAIRKRGGSDYIHFAWKDVTLATKSMRSALLVLVDLYRTKGHGVERARLDLLLEQANAMLEQLTTWAEAPNATMIKRA